MTQNTWQYQGRQEHSWFGDGTAPASDKAGRVTSASAAAISQRIHDVGHTLVAGLPASKRYHAAAKLSTEDHARLDRLLTATVQALPAGGPAIARHIFGVEPSTRALMALCGLPACCAMDRRAPTCERRPMRLAGPHRTLGLTDSSHSCSRPTIICKPGRADHACPLPAGSRRTADEHPRFARAEAIALGAADRRACRTGAAHDGRPRPA